MNGSTAGLLKRPVYFTSGYGADNRRASGSNTLHRTAKYFMDNGRAETHEEVMALLNRFGITVHVGDDIADSVHRSTALLTLVNISRRTLLGGVEITGLPEGRSITPIAPGQSLHEAVQQLGVLTLREPGPNGHGS